MRYLGMARKELRHIIMPDAFDGGDEGGNYEVVEIGGDILLMPPPLDRQRLVEVERLAKLSIDEHRETLDGLAR